uniref:Uncharacterized protein n=1 Tax=Anguilla anguilla TaxID=7936 RepID=A0A0E9SBF8_ANGAN
MSFLQMIQFFLHIYIFRGTEM